MEAILEKPPISTKCYHCGQDCDEFHFADNKVFCCYGCQTVYEILNANNLCEYYNLADHPGVSIRKADEENFASLDDPEIRKKLITIDLPEFARISFSVPSIHCVSCIWLLENLHKMEKGILLSEVNFSRKTVTFDFDPKQIKLSRLAALISSLGYPPAINLDSNEKNSSTDKSLVIKLAIAGFCFGNVMLFSFPEYLGLDSNDAILKIVFSYLNLALAIPVFLFSASDYLKSALKSFKQKQINIDVPIAAGLIALFVRSSYDIIVGFGPGYLDSFTGLVFFLLIGRWFQSKTYESLAFDRDFKSYFPLSVMRWIENNWKPTIIFDLNPGDQVKIRNMEIVPADSYLLDDKAFIDYSFVTGESKPVNAKRGDLIYAGGRLIGEPVRMTVNKKTSQSHLTSLWNNAAFSKVTTSKYKKIIDEAARKFTWIVLGIAFLTAIYWQFTNPSQMWLVLTSVLMVACPCALALAAPFTYGSMMRVFGRNNFYLKNADVVERIASINSVVFDKTGTVTHGSHPDVKFVGDLFSEEMGAIKLLTQASTHPMSAIIAKSIKGITKQKIYDFKEIPGKGIEATVDDQLYRIGSSAFTGSPSLGGQGGSFIFVAINGEPVGHFVIQTSIRKNIQSMIKRLGKKCDALLSGDTFCDWPQMRSMFPSFTNLFFNQSPHDKLYYVKNLQDNGKTVMMIGDGLNDSGALKQSDVGVAVTDDKGVFTPNCDAILLGDKLSELDKFISLAKSSTAILKMAFAISFFYNAVALSFAVTGHLTPLVAAILMPISSISVVGFSTASVNFVGNKKLNTAS